MEEEKLYVWIAFQGVLVILSIILFLLYRRENEKFKANVNFQLLKIAFNLFF